MPRRTLGRTLRRIRGLHFPPWLPVVFIILVVFGILGALFFVRSATGAPRQGDDWYATYEVIICGEPQPNIRAWDGGVHTFGSGDIHISPRIPSEEGVGARLVRWFEYGGDALGTGAKLTETELQLPGQRDVWKNGDECPDGTHGVLQVFVIAAKDPGVEKKLGDWSRYIPQDGDQVSIVFGPEEETVEPEATEETAEPEATEEIDEAEGAEATEEAEQPEATEEAEGEEETS